MWILQSECVRACNGLNRQLLSIYHINIIIILKSAGLIDVADDPSFSVQIAQNDVEVADDFIYLGC